MLQFNNFIIGLITPPLVVNTGFGTYVFFAVFCLLSLVWSYFFVPETKGQTLENMDRIFGDHDGENDRRRKRDILHGLMKEDHAAATERDKTIGFPYSSS